MAGLNLIQEYLSDTDEELEKSIDQNCGLSNIENIKTKLPLPQPILAWKGVMHEEEVIDDPLEHDGRVRSFKHERGNWATLVYIDYCPSIEILEWMKTVMSQTPVKGNIFEEFHVSLTRTLVLKFHWIDSFVEELKCITDGYHSFISELCDIAIYCNEERTRTFVGITIQSTNRCLKRLTHSLDLILNQYQLPSFYKDASYHISFIWCLGDQRKTLENYLPLLSSSLDNFLNNYPEQRYMKVERFKCKTGNKLYNFNLR